MKTIKQILDDKGRQVWSIQPDDSVYDAIKMMADKRVGALPVMRDRSLLGIVGERDYARKVILEGKSSRSTLVKEIMTSRVLCARQDQTVEEIMALMTEKRIRHLPVINGENIEGIISIGDLVKSIIDEQKFVIEQLEHYISGELA